MASPYAVPATEGFPPYQGHGPGTVPQYPGVQPINSGGIQPYQPQGMGPTGGPPTSQICNDGTPGAPNLQELQGVPGYEGLTFDAAFLPPPSYVDVVAPSDQPTDMNQNIPSLTEEQVREALSQFVSEHCCYWSKPVKEMKIHDIILKGATHYSLETYTEKRSTAWDFEPFKGQGLGNGGPSPAPWDIAVSNPSGAFTDMTVHTEVPNTAQVRMCHKCAGIGRVRCGSCCGDGGSSCVFCNGRGHKTAADGCRESCHSCNGTGRRRCSTCSGNGQVKCKICKGHCQLRFYVKLTISWQNNIGNNVSDTGDFPRELILNVTGQTAFESEMPRVFPINHFPDVFVKHASTSLISKHGAAYLDSRILLQRQRVRMVPISIIQYTWKEKTGHFHVYGFENQVHFPGYPSKGCCGCEIL